MKIKQIILVVTFLIPALGISAQELLSPSYTFSHQDTAYVTLSNGEEIMGTLKKLKRKKGLIKEVKIEKFTGEKIKLMPEEVQFMYLPPSGIDKLTKAADFITDAQKWNDEKMNQNFLNQGYIYFELAEVQVKRKNRMLLMQLMNPTFSKHVKVYHDPFAKETMSVGVGGVTVAGGHAKSYYISKTGQTAFRLKKKHYDKEYANLWGTCNDVTSKFPKKKWSNLTKHITAYSECEN
jgi:hypothetical protein